MDPYRGFQSFDYSTSVHPPSSVNLVQLYPSQSENTILPGQITKPIELPGWPPDRGRFFKRLPKAPPSKQQQTTAPIPTYTLAVIDLYNTNSAKSDSSFFDKNNEALSKTPTFPISTITTERKTMPLPPTCTYGYNIYYPNTAIASDSSSQPPAPFFERYQQYQSYHNPPHLGYHQNYFCDNNYVNYEFEHHYAGNWTQPNVVDRNFRRHSDSEYGFRFNEDGVGAVHDGDAGQMERVERVARNPMNSVMKTIQKSRPTSIDNLSFAARARLKRQASLPNSLDASSKRITLQPAPLLDTPEKLYHYTTEDGAFGILKDRFLRPKQVEGHWLDPSARFGTGIYFTSIPPSATTETILLNNYNKIFLPQTKYTEFCFEFLSKDLPDLLLCDDFTTHLKDAKERRRRIWMCKVNKLNLKTIKGKYYFRDLNGFDAPKVVQELTL